MPDEPPQEPWITLQVMMMPADANPIPTMMPGTHGGTHYGTIFGGVILSHIDMAGSIGARHEITRRGGRPLAFVTVAVNRVEFRKPVLVGDVVRFMTTIVRIGRTSATVQITVLAERGREVIHVTDAEVVYVGVDPDEPPDTRRPVPLLPDSNG